MNVDKENTSESEILLKSHINVNNHFCEYTIISNSEYSPNLLIKARRYGKWHVLKGIKPDCSHLNEYIELLNKEFDILFSLDHPNIVRAIDKEIDEKFGLCIVMEYIDGMTLSEFIQRYKGNRKLITKIVSELLDAMIYIHSKQIIHRDIKPDNILITHNGFNVKIIDFGLADTDYYDILKQPAGTLRYSAPEQRTKQCNIDNRVDIYAFGMLLIQMFTGKADKSMAYTLPNFYCKIAQKCIQENREKRYTSAKELKEAFTYKHRLSKIALRIISYIIILIAFLFIISHLLKDSTSIKELTDTMEEPLKNNSTKTDSTLFLSPQINSLETAHSSQTIQPSTSIITPPTNSNNTIENITTKEDSKKEIIIRKDSIEKLTLPTELQQSTQLPSQSPKELLMSKLEKEYKDSYTSIVGVQNEKIIPDALKRDKYHIKNKIIEGELQIYDQLLAETGNSKVLKFELKDFSDYVSKTLLAKFEESYQQKYDSLYYETNTGKRIIENKILALTEPDTRFTSSQMMDIETSGWETEIAKKLFIQIEHSHKILDMEATKAESLTQQVKIIQKYLKDIYEIEYSLRKGISRREELTILDYGFYYLFSYYPKKISNKFGLDLTVQSYFNEIYLTIMDTYYDTPYAKVLTEAEKKEYLPQKRTSTSTDIKDSMELLHQKLLEKGIVIFTIPHKMYVQIMTY